MGFAKYLIKNVLKLALGIFLVVLGFDILHILFFIVTGMNVPSIFP
jgi:lipopolysaccharide export LptBFGC system permease protein LptF